MKNIFLYPKHDRFYGSPNPYIFDFHRELAKKHRVVNKNAPNIGTLNLFVYFFHSEVFLFNWIENLPEKKFGRLQVAGFVFFLWLVRIFKKKIVWVLHNKGSHHQRDNQQADKVFRLMMRRSDKIITHSESGKSFVEETYPEQAAKVVVILHPISELFPIIDAEKTIDFLIWGSVHRYKGIDKFLNFLATISEEHRFKVRIVGKCFDKTYLKEITSYVNEDIMFTNEILELEEIYRIAQEAKFILFTYNSDTVISSGSLIDSIRMGSTILGPNHGAFKDLSNLSFVKTYENFGDIVECSRFTGTTADQLRSERDVFFKENNWERFIDKVDRVLADL
ncbi:Glycosyltransferase involved in cell wall bisynthesis [Cyclobacterium xiamenense]|uniref:Glycosyltransferase involved in cell wall bisynthesis n=2 Tax=Cyclobacterium xiamenense TaxID=1297121 RepID=A0A1H7AUC7_9BACT|nr:Glycosyltransferase involved in cell wall bisynthesis [Cyclobacterium xiamenense]